MEKIKFCLVTGASGFIGRVLCKELQRRGIKIRALLRQTSTGSWDEAVVQDLNQLSNDALASIVTEEIDTIFHLAGIAHTYMQLSSAFSKERYWQVNVAATEALLKAASNAKVQRFIYLSSVKALELEDEYGRSKKAAEKVVLELGQKYKIHTSILQPALVYGTQLKGNLLSMLRGIDRGWFPPVPAIQNRRSLVSVQDVVDAAILVAENPKANGKLYTLTDNRAYSTRQLYDGMRQALGLPYIKWSVPYWVLKSFARIADVIEWITRQTMPFNSTTLDKLLGSAEYSSSLIQEELGWAPNYNFFEALPEIIQTYKNNQTS